MYNINMMKVNITMEVPKEHCYFVEPDSFDDLQFMLERKLMSLGFKNVKVQNVKEENETNKILQ